MSDEKPKWDTPTNVKRSKPNEAAELARMHNISSDRAQMLIDRFGHDPEKLKAEAKASGAVCLLQKPFPMDALIDCLERRSNF